MHNKHEIALWRLAISLRLTAAAAAGASSRGREREKEAVVSDSDHLFDSIRSLLFFRRRLFLLPLSSSSPSSSLFFFSSICKIQVSLRLYGPASLQAISFFLSFFSFISFSFSGYGCLDPLLLTAFLCLAGRQQPSAQSIHVDYVTITLCICLSHWIFH